MAYKSEISRNIFIKTYNTLLQIQYSPTIISLNSLKRRPFNKPIHFHTFPHTYIQCSSIKCSSQFKYFITTRHFMWTEQKITMQLNFTFFTFIKSNANQSCLFWNIHVAPNTMFKGNNSCILLYKIQRCWFLSFLHCFDYFPTSVKPFVTKSNNCWLTPLLMENATYFLPRNVWQHDLIYERK